MKKSLGLIAAVLLLIPSLALAIDFANVKFGGQVRMRGYSLDNVWDFNDDAGIDEWDVFRLKASVFTGLDLGDNVTGFVRITNQNYGEGVTKAEGKNEEDNTSNKFFVDNAYIDVKNILGPVSLRIGRQNLIYGTGFVILDGQSQFASTSIYFDGIKATLDINDNVKLDAFYMKDEENTRWNMPEDNDITLTGFYLTAKECPVLGGQQEAYALHREDEANLFLGPLAGQMSQKTIWTYGIRLSDKMDCGLDYSGEVAVQMGTAFDGEDQDALGYKLDLGYTCLEKEYKPRIFGQYVFLSGDESDTDDYEGWDVLYGGWPQFGDLLAWKYVNGPSNVSNPSSTVPGEAAYTNLTIATIGLSCALNDVFFPKVSYSNLKFEETAAGESDDFGNYYQVNLKYKYSKALSFSVYYAVIDPGDAFMYCDAAREFFWEADLRF